jgi:hypothetical protein
MTLVKVGMCVAYDWHLLEFALPAIYAEADLILLSIDRDRVSWANQKFSMNDEKFYSFVKNFDPVGKIRILEENFHPYESPMQNEVYQRNRMAEIMGKDGWHVQLDCDEYFLDFASFVSFLRGRGEGPSRPVNICCPLITLYKKVDDGFLYVRSTPASREYLPTATRHPEYEYGRRNGHFNIYTNFIILHQSWARTDEEVLQKLANWGHKNDFDGGKYFQLWKSTTKSNFEQLKDFHPMEAWRWPGLGLIQGESVAYAIRSISSIEFKPLSGINLWMKNSRIVGKLKQLMGK